MIVSEAYAHRGVADREKIRLVRLALLAAPRSDFLFASERREFALTPMSV